MFKRILCFSLIIFFTIFLFNVSYATDVVMDLDANTAENNKSTEEVDNTIYSSEPNTSESDMSEIETTDTTNLEDIATTSAYEESSDLSITNMINIILIVVGIVLILLGIAIIIKLK